jgi:hypothetical protein
MYQQLENEDEVEPLVEEQRCNRETLISREKHEQHVDFQSKMHNLTVTRRPFEKDNIANSFKSMFFIRNAIGISFTPVVAIMVIITASMLGYDFNSFDNLNY